MKTFTLLVALFIASCASAPYWFVSGHAPIEVAHVVRVDCPCANVTPALACSNFAANTIEIDRRANAPFAACLERHERKHFAGYDHEAGRVHYSVNCGDGTTYTPLDNLRPLQCVP